MHIFDHNAHILGLYAGCMGSISHKILKKLYGGFQTNKYEDLYMYTSSGRTKFSNLRPDLIPDSWS